ncbi:MAG: peptide chain release factor 2 [Chloroflexi bacterium]|nr:peptide chain release factor 2 [Chloroflexota bacterium]
MPSALDSADVLQSARSLCDRVRDFRGHLDLASNAERLAELEAQIAEPEFWGDQVRARDTMREITRLKSQIEIWDELETAAAEVLELAELADADDADMLGDVAAEASALTRRLDALETQLLLGGEFDAHDAFLTIQSGAGGTESQDWAEMLLRMYSRWAERRKCDATVIEVSPGEEAGIKSATVQIEGDFAYGYLKAERGVHRLVRQSPFDAGNRRHTSFARVDVIPVLEEAGDIEIDPADLRVETFRAGGHGGQYVNKTDSAVRITHQPSGIVVSSQNQRSQHQNREVALQVLRARLLERDIAAREAEQVRLRGDLKAVDFGSQIRSYVLHPYRMVKDVRTGVEVGNTQAVLDGDLDVFIDTYLRATAPSTVERPS